MKENNIEEDIKIVENYLAHSAINETDSDFFKNGGWETVDLEIPKSMQHILSDYKRVLKENEELLELKVSASAHNRILELEKENKELQKEIDQMKSLDIYKLVEDWETGQFIPVQKVKDKIEELKKKVEELTDDKGYWGGSDLLEQIKVLQELLESEERK